MDSWRLSICVSSFIHGLDWDYAEDHESTIDVQALGSLSGLTPGSHPANFGSRDLD